MLLYLVMYSGISAQEHTTSFPSREEKLFLLKDWSNQLNQNPLSEIIATTARQWKDEEEEILRKEWEEWIDIEKGLNEQANPILGIFQHYLANYYRSEREDSLAIYWFQESVKNLETAPIRDLLELKSRYLLARTLRRSGQQVAAIAAFKEALKLSSILEDPVYEINALRRIGFCYDDLEEQALAVAYLEYAIIKAKRHYQNYETSLGNQYFSYAYRLEDVTGKKPQAINIYQKAIDIFEKGDFINQNNYLGAKINISQNQIDLNKLTAAKSTLMQALSIIKTRGDSLYLDIVYESLGAIHKRQNKLDSALYYFDQVRQIRVSEDADSEDFNYAYHNIGEVYDSMRNFEEAASYYQKAIIQAVPGFDGESPNQFPTLKEGLELSTSFLDLIKDFDHKGSLFYRWHLENQSLSHLEVALSSYEHAIDLIYNKRNELLSEESKLRWQSDFYPIFERAIQVAFLQYQSSSDPAYAELIFEWMEKSRALLLLDALNDQQVMETLPGQDSLIKQISEYRSILSSLQRRRIEEGLENRETILKAEIQLWETEGQLKRSSKDLKNNTQKDLEKLVQEVERQVLSKERLILEFFLGEASAFVAIVSQQGIQVQEIPISNLLENIEQLRALLSIASSEQADKLRLNQLSRALYDLLILPALADRNLPIEELIIVPDGLLSILPFEVLIPGDKTEKRLTTEFLLERYAISYAFSIATLLKQGKKKQSKAAYPFVGLAPSFGDQRVENSTRTCNASQLLPLSKNEFEVTSIHQLFGGLIASGPEAQRAFFLQQAMNAEIIHLATHACIDDLDPSRSRIFLQDDHLFTHELYDLDLQAKMVVLSACETGIGTFKRGEGVMSLARGFAQSGASSLTLSYWSVPDESTAQIMIAYYDKLSKGLPKHIALQQAKLSYLQAQEQVKRLHPYYWSAFVHLGDYSPISARTGWKPVYYLLVLIPALLLLYFSFLKKNKK